MGLYLVCSLAAECVTRRGARGYMAWFVPADHDIGISSPETALITARQTLASLAERAKQADYYSGARTDIINAHADLRAALDMLVKAAGPDDSGTTG